MPPCKYCNQIERGGCKGLPLIKCGLRCQLLLSYIVTKCKNTNDILEIAEITRPPWIEKNYPERKIKEIAYKVLSKFRHSKKYRHSK